MYIVYINENLRGEGSYDDRVILGFIWSSLMNIFVYISLHLCMSTFVGYVSRNELSKLKIWAFNILQIVLICLNLFFLKNDFIGTVKLSE